MLNLVSKGFILSFVWALTVLSMLATRFAAGMGVRVPFERIDRWFLAVSIVSGLVFAAALLKRRERNGTWEALLVSALGAAFVSVVPASLSAEALALTAVGILALRAHWLFRGERTDVGLRQFHGELSGAGPENTPRGLRRWAAWLVAWSGLVVLLVLLQNSLTSIPDAGLILAGISFAITTVLLFSLSFKLGPFANFEASRSRFWTVGVVLLIATPTVLSVAQFRKSGLGWLDLSVSIVSVLMAYGAWHALGRQI
jgi:hypothetical protein